MIAGIPREMDIHIGNCHIKKRTYGLFQDPIELKNVYVSQDPIATEYWLKMVISLAVCICSLVNILDPEMVIVGGGIAEAGDSLFNPFDEYMEKHEWRPEGQKIIIIKAKQGNFAGAIYEYNTKS